jgi:hypothetical protein
MNSVTRSVPVVRKIVERGLVLVYIQKKILKISARFEVCAVLFISKAI